MSGRDCDKIKEAGLTPVDADGTAAFEEAKLILVCRKQFHQKMTPENFWMKEMTKMVCRQGLSHHVYRFHRGSAGERVVQGAFGRAGERDKRGSTD